MTGESNHRFGVTPHNFKGRQIHSEGYVLLFAPDHPFAIAGKKSVMEHRLVLETHLRATDPGSPYLVEVDGVLYLRPEIEVHHRDHDKANNVVENLQPLTKQEHARLHQAERNG